MRRGIRADELLRRLREAAQKADPDAPSRRLAQALDGPTCGAPALVANVPPTAVELSCPPCGAGWAVEVAPGVHQFEAGTLPADARLMRMATRIVLRALRVVLVGLFWLSPLLALGGSIVGAPTPAIVIVLGVGLVCLLGAWVVDRKLRPHVRFWRRRQAAR